MLILYFILYGIKYVRLVIFIDFQFNLNKLMSSLYTLFFHDSILNLFKCFSHLMKFESVFLKKNTFILFY